MLFRSLGFRVCRVRHHETQARVEIGRSELDRALSADVADRIAELVRAVGYREVTIDPRGYRTGSLNEGIRLEPV